MIKLFLTDVDGCLTDGVYHTTEDGVISKNFYSRDFHGLSMLHDSGVKTAAITTSGDWVIHKQCKRAADYMKIFTRVRDKLDFVKRQKDASFYGWETIPMHEIAFIGDDVMDLPLLKAVGIAACPADAAAEVREYVENDAEDGFVTECSGGRGSVREFVDYILQINKRNRK